MRLMESQLVQRLRPLVAAQRAPTVCAVLLAIVGGVLIWLGTPLWWFGTSALVGAAICLWHAYKPQLMAARASLQRERTLRGRKLVLGTLLLDVGYCALLVWIGTIMMRDLIGGVRPISHDHTVHYFKAWQLHEYFLPKLKLHGFSHRWFAGYPVNYLYPIGTDLFVNLVHYVGLGLMPFDRAYGVAFWLFHVLTGYAGYRLGRALGGPHVGLISGFLLMTDQSAFRFGGWAYSIEYGVWPQALSLVFALLATVRVPAIYQERGLKPIGSFALLMGLSIVTHPTVLIYLGLLLVAAVLAALFAPGVSTARGTARLLCGYALATAVSAVWLLPFMQSAKLTTPMGVWWDSTYELGKGLINLDAFPGTIGYVLVCGMLALVLLLRSRQFALVLAALMALLVPAVSNSSFIDELHLPQLTAAFSKIQWLRMATEVKPFWFAIAGYFLVAFLRKAREIVPAVAGPDERNDKPRSLVREVVFSMIVAQLTLPFAVQACQAFFTANIAKALETESDRNFDTDRAALVDWLVHNLPKGGFYRVGVSTGHNHDLFDIGTQIGRPIYKRGFTPAENFIYKMNTEDRPVLEAVNVRYMIAKKWMPPEDFSAVVQFGIYTVYEFRHWKPDPFVITHGSGSVKMESFTDEEIRLRAAPGSKGKLRLNVSWFPRWHAYRDGKPVSLWPSSIKEAPNATGFMTVWLEPGEYRFVFERSALDHASALLSLFGVLVALAFVIAERLPRGLPLASRGLTRCAGWLEMLGEPRFRRQRRIAGGLLVLVGFGVVCSLAEWTPPLVLENLDGAVVQRVRFDFLEQLTRARAEIVYPSRTRRCRRLVDRFACRNEDGNIDNEKYVASTPAEIEEYRMVRCIRARPEENARLDITFPNVPTGEAIVGYFGIERAGRMLRLLRPVDFRITLDGEPILVTATQADNKMHWFRAPVGGPPREATVGFSVSAANVSRRFFCFYAQMADLKSGGPAKPTQRHAVGEDEDEVR